jgi:16S rRNA (guanine966-N2)-methyltransferase
MARRGGSLRIVAGDLRGRTIRIPRPVRPTTDRVRAAIFDALQQPPPARVLDCFAGSGGLGIEALSRGAGFVRFIEQDRRVAAVIRANLEALDLSPVAAVSVANVLATDLSVGGPFGLVLADPPYRLQAWEAIFERLGAPGVLEPDALIVAEHSARLEPPAAAAWRRWKTRRHGDTAFTIYQIGRPLPVSPGPPTPRTESP